VSAVYLASTVRDRVDEAQAMLDRHPAGVDGVCLYCGSDARCGRPQALQTLTRYGRLPRRRPGATRIGAHPRSGSLFGWFAAGVSR